MAATERTDRDDLTGPPGQVVERGGALEITLPAELTSVRVARHYVHERWTQLDDDTLGDVELIISELVANAVRHGRPDIVFRARLDPFAVDIAVFDQGEELPPSRPVAVSEKSNSGRGLTIVDRLAHAWGVEPHTTGPGKTVWASVSR
jgi:serine/threonine-protein kinase RsbW